MTLQLKEKVENLINAKFPNALISTSLEYDFPVFELDKSQFLEVMTFLKNDSQANFGFLTTLCGLHFPENGDKEFGMMYQLHNLNSNERIRIKVFMPKEDMKINSLTQLWPTANWMERQEYDFFGFKFIGHPNLVRILNMDEMNYFPMRKEYPLEDGSRDDKNDKMFGR
ncbi:MAG: NADH-quinone oxidoreductase subunit C [Bacteroidia bacterium]|nr:NADH-quinone oxidoreductase subunit C [Bacteroidia bacterium]